MDAAPKALVCDDDPVTRRVVADLLTDAGFEVVAELDVAPPLLELVPRLRPAVVVLDVSLMGMTGLEAIPRLRSSAPECAVVVFSSFDSARVDALAAGAFAAVDKTRPDELVDILAKLAGSTGSTGGDG